MEGVVVSGDRPVLWAEAAGVAAGCVVVLALTWAALKLVDRKSKVAAATATGRFQNFKFPYNRPHR
ncbi:hypothetical protein [Streptomyces sp. NPDC001275]